MHDDEKILRANMCTKPETPVDGACENWVAAPATGPRYARGRLPSSSHASVAQTATRPSSQGPASALRFNYYKCSSTQRSTNTGDCRPGARGAANCPHSAASAPFTAPCDSWLFICIFPRFFPCRVAFPAWQEFPLLLRRAWKVL